MHSRRHLAVSVCRKRHDENYAAKTAIKCKHRRGIGIRSTTCRTIPARNHPSPLRNQSSTHSGRASCFRLGRDALRGGQRTIKVTWVVGHTWYSWAHRVDFVATSRIGSCSQRRHINRVRAVISDRPPHTTWHAGPHQAVQRSGASDAQRLFRLTSPCSCSHLFVMPTPLAMVFAMCQ